MAQNKKEEFGADEIALADFARAIAHPARVAILTTLAQRNSCICGEIVDGLPLAQATVSQHLKELKNAGLIKGAVDGTKSCYCINWKSFDEFNERFSKFFSEAKRLVCEAECCG